MRCCGRSKTSPTRQSTSVWTDPPQTKATEETTGAAVDVYVAGGELSCVEAVIPDFVVTMASGEEYRLWEIMSDVSDYWRQFLTETGIPLAADPHYFPDEAC